MVGIQNGWNNVVCETDAKNVVNCLNNGSSLSLHWSADTMLRKSGVFVVLLNLLGLSGVLEVVTNLLMLLPIGRQVLFFCGLIHEDLFPREISVLVALEKGDIPSA